MELSTVIDWTIMKHITFGIANYWLLQTPRGDGISFTLLCAARIRLWFHVGTFFMDAPIFYPLFFGYGQILDVFLQVLPPIVIFSCCPLAHQSHHEFLFFSLSSPQHGALNLIFAIHCFCFFNVAGENQQCWLTRARLESFKESKIQWFKCIQTMRTSHGGGDKGEVG